MEALDLARWQFGITTVYHFLQVPLTIGMAFLVAIMQTKAYKGGPNAKAWDKLAQFFGKLLVINFALGAATGIVQEFQFGMNWSEYARYMGDIFGAPLAFEALLSFFLESTFVGIWIFGRGRISPKAHLASIWCFSAGTFTSALWIIAANSFMQDPHGAVVDPETGRAILENKAAFVNVLFNKTSILAFTHTISAAFMVSATMILALSMWWMAKSIKAGRTEEAENYWRPAAKFGAAWLVVGSIAGILTGHFIGQHVGDIQPQKFSAMMGICDHSDEGREFTLIRWGECNENGGELPVPIPGLESFMATNDFNAPLKSVDEANAELQAKYSNPATYDADSMPSEQMLQTYADQDYRPNVNVSYYSFRVMMALGFLLLLAALVAFYFLRSNKLYNPKGNGSWWNWLIPLPFLASMFGWIMTEMGRQPFIVNPTYVEPGSSGSNMVMLLTEYGLSGSVQMQSVLISLVGFTAIYTFLGVIWIILLRRYAIEGINPAAKVIEYDESAEAPITFMY